MAAAEGVEVRTETGCVCDPVCPHVYLSVSMGAYLRVHVSLWVYVCPCIFVCL